MSTTRAAPGRGALTVAVLGLVLAGTLAAARTAPGRDLVSAAGSFLEYYAGVFTLVTLTGAVFFGAIAALRILPPGPRVVVQALHRSAAVTAVGFLVTHALLKVMEAHAKPLDLVVPTSVSWVALGTISGDLLVLAAATGAVRGRYAATVRPWAWRTLHCTVYATWPIALAHGLLAGRAPKSWVTISYLACAAAIIGILLLRSATTSRHEPPGSVPLPDLSSLAEPRRGEGERSGPRTASFADTPRAAADRSGPGTDSFASGPPPDDPDRAGPRTASPSDEPRRGDAGRRATSFMAEPGQDGADRAGLRRDDADPAGPHTGPVMDEPERAGADGLRSRMASFVDDLARGFGDRAGSPTTPPADGAGPGAPSFVEEPLAEEQARLRAASGTASYVDPPHRPADPAGSRTTGPFPPTGPRPDPQPRTSGPFPATPSSGPFPATPQTPTSGPFPTAPSTDPFAAAPQAPTSGQFPAAPSTDPFAAAPSSGPFPAAEASGAGDRLVAGAFGDRAWPPPPPPPPASIADLIGPPGEDAGGPRTASGRPTPPTPPRIEDVISDASAGPRGPGRSGPSRPGAFPHTPGADRPHTPPSGTPDSADYLRADAQARTAPAGFAGPTASPRAAAQHRTTPDGTAGPDAVRVATGPRDGRPDPARTPRQPADPRVGTGGPDAARTPRPTDTGLAQPREAAHGTNAVRAKRSTDPGPEPQTRKGKKGRHQSRSIDEQDAAFWASLRAERPDWTRP